MIFLFEDSYSNDCENKQKNYYKAISKQSRTHIHWNWQVLCIHFLFQIILRIKLGKQGSTLIHMRLQRTVGSFHSNLQIPVWYLLGSLGRSPYCLKYRSLLAFLPDTPFLLPAFYHCGGPWASFPVFWLLFALSLKDACVPSDLWRYWLWSAVWRWRYWLNSFLENLLIMNEITPWLYAAIANFSYHANNNSGNPEKSEKKAIRSARFLEIPQISTRFFSSTFTQKFSHNPTRLIFPSWVFQFHNKTFANLLIIIFTRWLATIPMKDSSCSTHLKSILFLRNLSSVSAPVSLRQLSKEDMVGGVSRSHKFTWKSSRTVKNTLLSKSSRGSSQLAYNLRSELTITRW